jgi:hypothetical protein
MTGRRQDSLWRQAKGSVARFPPGKTSTLSGEEAVERDSVRVYPTRTSASTPPNLEGRS